MRAAVKMTKTNKWFVINSILLDGNENVDRQFGGILFWFDKIIIVNVCVQQMYTYGDIEWFVKGFTSISWPPKNFNANYLF